MWEMADFVIQESGVTFDWIPVSEARTITMLVWANVAHLVILWAFLKFSSRSKSLLYLLNNSTVAPGSHSVPCLLPNYKQDNIKSSIENRWICSAEISCSCAVCLCSLSLLTDDDVTSSGTTVLIKLLPCVSSLLWSLHSNIHSALPWPLTLFASRLSPLK